MNKTVSRDEERPKRKRRTAEVARREILDAAKKRLMKDGPDGLRLKYIADDLGISHSSILHHFGSREQLLADLRNSAFAALAEDLRQRMSEPSEGDPAVALFERIAETLGKEGYGRLLAWQMMAGQPPTDGAVGRGVLGPDGSGGLLGGLANMLHGLRVERAQALGQTEPDRGETRQIVALVACTLLGESIVGDVMVRSAGLGREPEDRRAFRGWIAKLVERQVFPEPPEPSEEHASKAPTSDGNAAPSPRRDPVKPARARSPGSPRRPGHEESPIIDVESESQ